MMNRILSNRIQPLRGRGIKLLRSNGKEALLQPKKELPDLIIMDVMMPEMDGMKLAKTFEKS
jgi:CheY-like chemotaxis protein